MSIEKSSTLVFVYSAALAGVLAFGFPSAARAQRDVVSLDGDWQIEDSLSADQLPSVWRHTVQVPGMANLARPGFPDVDQYLTRGNILDQVYFGLIPKGAPVPEPGPKQNRNYFWYQKTFRAPRPRQVALLRINKAQFGTAVWLNGKKIGEHAGCFTAGYFDLTPALDWSGENRLVVRIGAHPGVLPENFPSGTDFEKVRWTSGIYDSVSVLLADNPVIQTVQVAPRINPPEILVQIKLKNYGIAPARCQLEQRVETWREARPVNRSKPRRITLAPGETKIVTETLAVPSPHLWTPETPYLYVLRSSTGGDSVSTRFGMRELRFDTATGRAWLNGRIYFLRGSNITLHRFFEDPAAGALPWTEAWVRKLLVDIPKRMNWNSFRFCIGPVPDRWLDIADEAGLLIQNEFFMWTGDASVYKPPAWDTGELIRQYGEWMRDNWNHPSVVIWDANNETNDPLFGEKVIPAVRGLDLSNRPWENSYNPPVGPDDPMEEHPYFHYEKPHRSAPGGKPFEMSDLEDMDSNSHLYGVPSGHAKIANEYGWLWLLRDGTPTIAAQAAWGRLHSPTASPRERLALNAYMIAGETEFFRSRRHYAGVLHFVYLASGHRDAYTCDHFEDIPSLKLHPEFADYLREAFKPLGVCLNFWHPTLKAGSDKRFVILMVNDQDQMARGKLVLSLERESGGELTKAETPFAVPGLGQETYSINLHLPQTEDKCLLKAAAYTSGKHGTEPTLSRRFVSLTAANLVSHSRKDNRVLLNLTEGQAEIEWVSAATFRFAQTWKHSENATAVAEREPVPLTLTDSADRLEIRSADLTLEIEKHGLRMHVKTAGGLPLLADFSARQEGQAVVLTHRISAGERFYGLGPREDPRIDASGVLIEAARPYLVSSRGYGVEYIAPGTYTFDVGHTDPRRARVTASTGGRAEFYFYQGATPKEIFEQRLEAVGHPARLGPAEIDVRLPMLLPKDATQLPYQGLPSWRSLQTLVRMLIHGSLSAVLLPALDLAPYRAAEEAVRRRASQLAALVPVLFDSDPARGVVLHPEGRELRRLLTPFLLTYAQEVYDRGFPLIHPLLMQYPNDPESWRRSDEFLFGDEILVAPITTPDGKRPVYFPMGNWTRLKTDEVYRGKQTAEIAAGDDELPLFVKNGSILPLAPVKPGAAMTAHYFPSLGAEFFLSEEGLWSPTQLHASPAGDYLRLETESKKDRDYEWVVHHSAEPRKVVQASISYKRVASRDLLGPGCWYYAAERRSLHVMVRAAAGTDVVVNIEF